MSKMTSVRALISIVLLIGMPMMNYRLISIAQNAGVIRGRLVDSRGIGVSDGRVVVVAIDRSGNRKSVSLDLVVPYFSADSEGRFVIPKDSAGGTAMLFGLSGVTSDSSCLAPIMPPFNGALLALSEFNGRKITINPTGDTNLGDILCQLYYASAKITFGAHLGVQFDRLRLRDWRGDIVHQSVLVKPVNVHDGICMMLPYGTWYIEFGRGQECADWHSIGKVVYAEGSKLIEAKGLTKSDEIVRSVADPQLARQELGNMGMTPDKESLSKGAEYGNRSAVRLLLDLGLNPNETDEHGAAPIIEAAMGCYNDIVSDLLARGADPNAATDRGLTAIMAASGSCGCGATLTELIAHGADVNRRTVDGVTALMLAVGNGHSGAVGDLLKVGADRYAKDNQGKTALEVAIAAGRDDIIKLLSVKSK